MLLFKMQSSNVESQLPLRSSYSSDSVHVVLFVVWKCYIHDWKRKQKRSFVQQKGGRGRGETRKGGGGKGKVEKLN